MPSDDGWFSVTYGSVKFVAVTIGPDKAAYKIDGKQLVLGDMEVD